MNPARKNNAGPSVLDQALTYDVIPPDVAQHPTIAGDVARDKPGARPLWRPHRRGRVGISLTIAQRVKRAAKTTTTYGAVMTFPAEFLEVYRYVARGEQTRLEGQIDEKLLKETHIVYMRVFEGDPIYIG